MTRFDDALHDYLMEEEAAGRMIRLSEKEARKILSSRTPVVLHQQIMHDDGCPKLHGAQCWCNPDVMFFVNKNDLARTKGEQP